MYPATARYELTLTILVKNPGGFLYDGPYPEVEEDWEAEVKNVRGSEEGGVEEGGVEEGGVEEGERGSMCNESSNLSNCENIQPASQFNGVWKADGKWWSRNAQLPGDQLR